MNLTDTARSLCSSDDCPACGAIDMLIDTAPPLPALLLETGDDAAIEVWEHEHNYNILQCLGCGWRSDET